MAVNKSAVKVCPECGWPVDGAAKGRRRHIDCQARVEKEKQIAVLTHKVRDYTEAGKSVTWIGAQLHIGNDTVRKLLKGGAADEERV